MIGALITLIIYIIVVGILLWLAWYVLDAIPVPEPLNRFAKIGITVIVVLVIVLLLLNFAGVDTGIRMPT
jgi:hypothetical protein